jgi:hypothetical protein
LAHGKNWHRHSLILFSGYKWGDTIYVVPFAQIEPSAGRYSAVKPNTGANLLWKNNAIKQDRQPRM